MLAQGVALIQDAGDETGGLGASGLTVLCSAHIAFWSCRRSYPKKSIFVSPLAATITIVETACHRPRQGPWHRHRQRR